MATPGRTSLYPLIWNILNNPKRYEFVQALRILEKFDLIGSPCAFQSNESTVEDSASFTARFLTQCNLVFPSSVISKGFIYNQRIVSFTISTFGLIGPTGTLPYSYSAIVNAELQKKNSSLKSFIDIFQNRSVSLFYGACTKYRLIFAYERREKSHGDDFKTSIDSVNGMNSRYFQNRLGINDDIIAYFTGFFSSQKRNASGLENVLTEMLQVPVHFCPFRGYWINILEHDRSALTNNASTAKYNLLGVDCIAGNKVWSSQNSFRLYIGPVELDDFVKLLPGGKSFSAINSIVALYCGKQFRFEIKILLERSSVPSTKIRNLEDNRASSILGRNTWLLSHESTAARDDPVFLCE